MQVTMKQNRFKAGGVLMAVGSTQDLSDDFAQELVGQGAAVYVTVPVATDFRPDGSPSPSGAALAVGTLAPLPTNPLRQGPLVRLPYVDHPEPITYVLGPTIINNEDSEYNALKAGKREINFQGATNLAANKDFLKKLAWGVSFIGSRDNFEAALSSAPIISVSPVSGDWFRNGCIALVLTGREITFSYRKNTSANTAQVFVDGYCLPGSASAFGVVTNSVSSSGNAKQWITLTFPEHREWLIYVPIGQLNSIVVPRSATISGVEKVGKAAIFGDSIALRQNTTGETDKKVRANIATDALECLGWDATTFAIGGSGFKSEQGNRAEGKESFGGVMDYLKQHGEPLGLDFSEWDLVWLFGSANDNGQVNIPYVETIQKALDRFPNAKVAVSSVYEGFPIPESVATTLNDLLYAAVQQVNNPRVTWVPVDGKYHPFGSSVFTGSGRKGGETGDGNADLFLGAPTAGTDRHPNADGCRHGANFYAVEMLRNGLPYSTRAPKVINEVPASKSGTSTQSGTGAQTVFTIAHGLRTVPAVYSIVPGSAAAAAPSFSTADATNITVTFTTAPAAGTGNVVLRWSASL